MDQSAINEIFTDVKLNIQANVIQSYPSEEPEFPAVIVEYDGDTSDMDTIDSSGENYLLAGFVTDIFTQGSNRVNEANELQNEVKGILSGKYQMWRASQERTNNFLNKDIMRIRTVYHFRIDENNTIYRR